MATDEGRVTLFSCRDYQARSAVRGRISLKPNNESIQRGVLRKSQTADERDQIESMINQTGIKGCSSKKKYSFLHGQ